MMSHSSFSPWDADGNLTQRQDAVSGQTENFTYDFLDRLTGVSGAYSNSYTYNQIGNITSMNGTSYTYGTKPHAVTAVGSTSYAYDANGNMTTRSSQTLTWDVQNRLVGVTGGGVTMSAVYDGDGNRVKKTEGGQTVLYVNQYYDKNLTTGVVTTHYYLAGKEIAYRKGGVLEYICQDHLGSTSVTTSSSGAVVATVAYFPFGDTRAASGPLNTDELFTGHRLDQTGLYFYNARYYDAFIGRFISADTVVQRLSDPQMLNRYSYCLNNPLRYVDPTGHTVEEEVALSNQAAQLRAFAAPTAQQAAFFGFMYLMSVLNGTPDAMAMRLAQSFGSQAASFNAVADSLEQQSSLMRAAREQAEREEAERAAAALALTAAGAIDAGAGAVVGGGFWDAVATSVVTLAPTIGLAIVVTGLIFIPSDVNVNQHQEAEGKQDKKLTPGEIDKLKKKLGEDGTDIHEVKEGLPNGDLYKKPNGDIVLKPLGGDGPGEDIGYNINYLE